MTRKDRTEGIFSRREVLDATERQKYYQNFAPAENA